MDNEKISQLMKRKLELDIIEKATKTEKETIRSEILISLKTNELDQFEDDNGNTAVIKRYNVTTIDKEKVEKFCEDTGQEISYFQKTAEREQLNIKAGEKEC